MKVFIYLRVSTEFQQLDPQRSELLSYCKNRGFEIVGEYSDVLSGTKRARPGLNAMLARCMAGDAKAVLVVKLDRLARSLVDFVAITRQLEGARVGFICTSQGIDTTEGSPTGRLMQHLLAAIAEFERDLISERTKAGLVTARANGKTLGTPSLLLVPNWAEVIEVWRKEPAAGYGELARRLGGVSKSTAWKLANGKLRTGAKANVSTQAGAMGLVK